MKGVGGPEIMWWKTTLLLLLQLALLISGDEKNDDYQVGRVIRQIVYNERFGNHIIRPAIKIAEYRTPPEFPTPLKNHYMRQFMSSYKIYKPSYKLTFKKVQSSSFNPVRIPDIAPNFSTTFDGFGKQGCNCVHLVACAGPVEQMHLQGCSMLDGASGVCCPDEVRNPPWGGVNRLFSSKLPHVDVPPVSPEQLNQACHKGVNSVNDIKAVENRLMRTNVLKRGTPARGHLKFFQVTRSARSTHRGAMAISIASESMKRDFRLNNEQSCIGLRQFTAKNTILSANCPLPPRCNHKIKYRSIDGSCNNLKNPLWGRSETSFQRILPAKYGDGIRSPRMLSVTGALLPNPRKVSKAVITDSDKPHPQFTLSVMQWGQFLDHDLTHTPFASFDNNEGKECCKDGQIVTPQLLEDCWPIELPSDDEFYAPRNQKCMNFVRSMLAEDDECSFGCAEQMNQVTHWLDASTIYGSSNSEVQRLRDPNSGLLLFSHGNLLPYQTKRSFDCEATEGTNCFLAGDFRVNEQPALTAMHTLWMREHNRVARALHAIHPEWSPEAVFQETRRIVLAQFQHIVYNEWLPIILGEPFMRSFDIMPKREGYNLDYNPSVKTNIHNELSTAAMRFGHTLVQGTMRLFSRFGRQSTLRLKDHFNSPHLYHRNPEMVNMFARTFTKQSIQSFDSFITKELTDHLFETPQTDFGMDLMSLNVQRGRDHAIATYNEMRTVCGLPRAKTFHDLLDRIPPDRVQRLASVYSHVDDIDLFMGGISETPVAGGLLGWTFLCIIGDQFARMKKGDRFFYDIGGQPGSFKPIQLEEIRKASWARVLCDNAEIDLIQPLALRLPSNLNPEMPCNSPSIPIVNLEFWRGEIPHA